MKVAVAFAILALSVATSAPPRATEVVVTMTAEEIPGAQVPEVVLRVMQDQFPERTVAITYLTDGDAVRATVSGRAFALMTGRIRLSGRGGGTVVTVDTSTRTYWEESAAGGTYEGDPPHVTVVRSGQHRTILGYPAERIDIACRQLVHIVDPAGTHPPVTREVRADVVNWCTSAVSVPAAMTRMMNVAARFVPLSDASVRSACVLPLESTVTLSTLEGFRVVSRVEAIHQLASVPAAALQVPPGYRRVDPASAK